MSKDTIKRGDADVIIEKLNGKIKISVNLKDNAQFSPVLELETSYSIPLIEKILDVKGPAWVCNEIMREECPDYIPNVLKYDILSYADPDLFKGKRILDFGCGCGSSTVIMSRMFPESTIVGIEYVKDFVDICEMRKEFLELQNVEFLVSPSSEKLPEEIGKFDYILLSGVFEHLLPDERKNLFPKIWEHLKPDGIMFLNGTPHRYFPVEIHTTSGLPLLNYLPKKMAHLFARKISKRGLGKMSWNDLLRNGIRGGSVHEIVDILKNSGTGKPLILKPQFLDVNDRIDLWRKSYGSYSHSGVKKIIYYFLKGLKMISGIQLTPYISLAIQKRS